MLNQPTQGLQEKCNPELTTTLIPRTGTCLARTALLCNSSEKEPAHSKCPACAVPMICWHSDAVIVAQGPLPRLPSNADHQNQNQTSTEKQQVGSLSAQGMASTHPCSSLLHEQILHPTAGRYATLKPQE